MSSILKALQKLEKEKSARRPDFSKIDAEILRNKPSRQVSRTGIFLAALLFFICGSGAMYVYMKQRPVVSISAPLAGHADKEVVMEPPATVTQPEASTRKPVFSEARLPEKTASQTLPVQQPVESSRSYQAIAPAEKKQGLDTRENPPEPSQKNRRSTPVATIPLLTVSGIAFQDGGAENIAVVNGLSVSRGSVMDGVTVTEIMKDRVKFNVGGESIEVGLGKSNR